MGTSEEGFFKSFVVNKTVNGWLNVQQGVMKNVPIDKITLIKFSDKLHHQEGGGKSGL